MRFTVMAEWDESLLGLMMWIQTNIAMVTLFDFFCKYRNQRVSESEFHGVRSFFYSAASGKSLSKAGL